MKVAWNFKSGGITGFTLGEDELTVLHDVFSTTVQPGAQKASYVLQFLWRDLTSSCGAILPNFIIHTIWDTSRVCNAHPESLSGLPV